MADEEEAVEQSEDQGEEGIDSAQPPYPEPMPADQQYMPPNMGVVGNIFHPEDLDQGEGEEEAPQEPSFPLPQYVPPEMPQDLKICDRYFVKPGEWEVTPSGTLVPGTGMRPPNIPLAESIQDDILTPLVGLAVDAGQFPYKEIVDTCSVLETKDIVDVKEDESEEELILDSFDSEFLKTHLGIPLTLALTEIVAKKPSDPIHYLGHWLFKWRFNQEAREVETEKVNVLIQERKRLAAEAEEQKRLKDEKMALNMPDELTADTPEPQDLGNKMEEFGEDGLNVSGDNVSDIDEQL